MSECMIEYKLKRMKDAIKLHGYDWSDLEVSNLILNDREDKDMRKIILPKDKEFFQKQYRKTFSDIKLPAMDYRGYNFNDVSFINVRFEEDSILPNNFFQVLKNIEGYGVVMPSMDYGEFNFSGVGLAGIEFPRHCKFPNDRELFQNIKDKSLSSSKLPELDFTVYNLEGVSFESTIIRDNSKLPENFFQVIKDKSVQYTSLPSGDYSDFDFRGVGFNHAKFGIDSKLPKNRDLFQNIYSKDLTLVTLPRGDYSGYDFKGVSLIGTKKTADSKFPEYSDFLLNVYDEIKNDWREDICLGESIFGFTDNMLKNMHNYNLAEVRIDLRDYSEKISEDQLSVIRTRYRELIGETIFLPEKSLMKDTEEVRDRKLKNKDNLTLNI